MEEYLFETASSLTCLDVSSQNLDDLTPYCTNPYPVFNLNACTNQLKSLPKGNC